MHTIRWQTMIVALIGLASQATTVTAGDRARPGVARISDRGARRSTAISRTSHSSTHGDCPSTCPTPMTGWQGYYGHQCDECPPCRETECKKPGSSCLNCCCCKGCWNKFLSNDLKQKLCKFGYFFPTGCGGAGCPLVGRYGIAYQRNPYYWDLRDSRLWSAPGYGVPMAVPLAPNVEYQYNFGWGVPSSRITPISRLARPNVPPYRFPQW